jgi:hypothetical protein
MTRREFSRKVRAEIILRATNADGVVCCEGCGLVLGKKPYEIDHTIAEWLVTDKSLPLRADDGRLLGKACCHAPKTAVDIRTIRKVERIRDRDSGAMRRKSKFPCSKDSPYRKKLDGSVVPR